MGVGELDHTDGQVGLAGPTGKNKGMGEIGNWCDTGKTRQISFLYFSFF